MQTQTPQSLIVRDNDTDNIYLMNKLSRELIQEQEKEFQDAIRQKKQRDQEKQIAYEKEFIAKKEQAAINHEQDKERATTRNDERARDDERDARFQQLNNEAYFASMDRDPGEFTVVRPRSRSGSGGGGGASMTHPDTDAFPINIVGQFTTYYNSEPLQSLTEIHPFFSTSNWNEIEAPLHHKIQTLLERDIPMTDVPHMCEDYAMAVLEKDGQDMPATRIIFLSILLRLKYTFIKHPRDEKTPGHLQFIFTLCGILKKRGDDDKIYQKAMEYVRDNIGDYEYEPKGYIAEQEFKNIQQELKR